MEKEELGAVYAEALKDAYKLLRQRYRPEFRGLGSRYDSELMTFGLALHANKIDPYSYVSFVFDMHARHSDDVYVNMILSPSSLQRYLLNRPDRLAELKIIVKSQAQHVAERLNHGETMSTILTDWNAPLSAVFRYATAWFDKNQELCKMFYEDAKRMLIFEPYYKDLLGHILPEDLKRV